MANTSMIEADHAQIADWVEQFHRDGFLFLHNVLRPDLVSTLRNDLDEALAEHLPSPRGGIELRPRMFERSSANLSLFDLEPIVSFAEGLTATTTHVSHNNSFRTRYITQISYARRIIGHKYAPFMNYQMPEYIYRDTDERLRVLLGFLPGGAYG